MQVRILSRTPRSRRGFARNVATAIIVTAPIVTVPLLLQGGASATNQPRTGSTPSGVACVNGQLDVDSFAVGIDATVSVSLASTDCDYQTVTLVAYSTQGPDYNSAGTQTLFDKDTEFVQGDPVTFSVKVPNCFYQIDLIYGDDTPATLADQELYFTHHGTLIASYNAANPNCNGTPSSSGSPSVGPSGGSTGTPTVCASSGSAGSSSGTPSVGAGDNGGSGCSTSPGTPGSSTPGSVQPSAGSTSPGTSVGPTEATTTPGGSVLPTVTITTSATTTSTSTTTSTATGSPTGSASVGGEEFTQGGSPTPATSVLGEEFTQGPGASVLPFTGMPVAAVVLVGLELLGAGILAVLYVRRRSGGAHR